jgi:hypothetical protein
VKNSIAAELRPLLLACAAAFRRKLKFFWEVAEKRNGFPAKEIPKVAKGVCRMIRIPSSISTHSQNFMKKQHHLIAFTIALMTSIPASAATDFTNAGGLVSVAGNWNNGLPTGANQGTININASADSNVSLSGYNVVQTGGVFSHTNLAAVSLIDNTTWQINGASASTNTSFRGFNVRSGSDFTLTSGTVNTTSGRDWALGDAGSTLTVNGGSLDFGRSLVMQGSSGGIFTISAGSATGTGSIGGNSIQDNTHTLNFNGGTSVFGNLDLRGDNTFFKFGGSTTGSLETATVNTGGTFGSNSIFDWQPGTKMTMTVTGQSGWAETFWNANKLAFDGEWKSVLSNLSWADASNAAIGLGSGYYWNYSGQTLSLGFTAIPEPTSALASLLLGAGLLRRRRL